MNSWRNTPIDDHAHRVIPTAQRTCQQVASAESWALRDLRGHASLRQRCHRVLTLRAFRPPIKQPEEVGHLGVGAKSFDVFGSLE
jgi:hypothetical protein